MKKIIIAYVPVVHRGYLELFQKYPDAFIYLLGLGIIGKFPRLKKDLRYLDPTDIRKMLGSVRGLEDRVFVIDWVHIEGLNRIGLTGLASSWPQLIMPDEDISHELAQKHLPSFKVTFEPTFLRYDKIKVQKEDPVHPDVIVSFDDLDRNFMGLALAESQKSEDWWRQVGAVAVKKDRGHYEVILARHNQHTPTTYSLYIYGDPRSNYSKGLNYEFSTAIHAEAGIVAEAANKGISLNSASLYVTTFPCPPCAKVLALTGIKKLFFQSGYSVLEGQELLKNNGIRIIQVK